MDREINGDDRLSFFDRLRYLIYNLKRNLLGAFPSLAAEHWAPSAQMLSAHASFSGSPGRVLMDMFIAHELPKIVPPKALKVLDLGCGAGHLRFALEQSGYFGEYTGVDISDHRFRSEQSDAFPNPSILVGDAGSLELPGSYDLVISMSALEHFPDDLAAIENAEQAMTEHGLHVHFVPNGCALPLYLWHGFRQYNAQAIDLCFPARGRTIWKLGGLPSFLLHFVIITCFEQVMRLNVRRIAPNAYDWLNRHAIRFDSLCSAFAATTVVVTRKS